MEKNGKHTAGELLKFAFPTVVMMGFMGAYTLTDTIFIARYAGTDALAAVNVVCPVINLTVGLGTMLAAGGNAAISRELGRGKRKRAQESFTQIVLAGGMLGVMILLAGQIWMDGIIRGLGASEVLYGFCREYLGTLLLFTPANMLQTLFASLFVTAGRPGLGSALAIGAGLINIGLDYLFVAAGGMGIRGAALGTGIGYLLPAAGGMIYFGKRPCGKGGTEDRRILKFCSLKRGIHEMQERDESLGLGPGWRMLAECCLNGSSEMVGQLAAAITTFLFNRVMLRLAGENGVAAITIAIYAQFLLSTLYIGFAMGTAPVIGYHYGAGRYDRLRQLAGGCMKVVFACSVVVFLAAFAGSPWLVRLFAAADSRVYEMAVPGFRIFSFSFLFCGGNIWISAWFTALSDGKTSAVLSFCRTFVFLAGGILLLPRWLGIMGVWLAVPAAEGAALCMAGNMLRRLRGRFAVLADEGTGAAGLW